MSIFVSVASYCDPLLGFTLSQALATARRPDEIHFGIVDQSPAGAPPFNAGAAEPARISYVRLDTVYARGPCWARAIAMSLYDGEDWYFQIDSHMDFDADWDERLVEHAQALLPGRRGVAITAYPHPFVLQGDRPVHRPTTSKVLAHVVCGGSSFDPGHPVLPFAAHPVEVDHPVAGFHLAAGCLFAPGTLAQAFPYDPWFYFHGEEQALALRLFTHGWDIFHIPALPVYHLYNAPDSGAPPRPLHWDERHEQGRSRAWWDFEQRSRDRLDALVSGADLGVYGLGTVRSIADYAAFSGIDFERRTLDERAFTALADR